MRLIELPYSAEKSNGKICINVDKIDYFVTTAIPQAIKLYVNGRDGYLNISVSSETLMQLLIDIDKPKSRSVMRRIKLQKGEQ